MQKELEDRRSTKNDEIRFYAMRNIISIVSNASVTEACQTMCDKNIGSLLIEKNGEYVGIVTEGDISRRVIAQIKRPIDVQVEAIMSKPIITIESNQLMVTAFLMMEKHGVRHIAVSESKKIIGLLSIRDFSKYYIRKFSKRTK